MNGVESIKSVAVCAYVLTGDLVSSSSGSSSSSAIAPKVHVSIDEIDSDAIAAYNPFESTNLTELASALEAVLGNSGGGSGISTVFFKGRLS
jgi:hypothetical protein